ncbi:MAG: MFS transporter [Candidatus Dormibacterales bacterium]
MKGRAAGGVSLLALGGVVLVAFNQRVVVTTVPPLLLDLHLTRPAQSLLVTAPVFCFAVAAFAGPPLRSRVGDEWGIFLASAGLVVGLVGRALWPGWGLFLGTAVAAFSIGLTNVLLSSLVRRRFRDRMGVVTAAYTMSLTIGSGLAAALTVPIRNLSGGSLEVALGIWALPAAAALVAWAPQLRASGGRGDGDRGDGDRAASRPGPFGNATAWHVTLFFGFQSWVFYGMMSWIPVIYRGFGPEVAGLLLALVSVGGVVGNVAAVAGNRMRDQRAIVAVTVAVVGAGAAGVMVGPHRLALLWVIVLSVGIGAAFSLALLLVVLRAGDPTVASRLSSMSQGVGYLIAGTGPFAVGLLHADTGGWGIPLAAVLLVVVGELVFGVYAGRARVVGGRAGLDGVGAGRP